MKKQKQTRKWKILLFSAILIAIVGFSFAYFIKTLSGTKKYVLVGNGLRVYLDESKTLTDVVEGTKTIPVTDDKGKETDGYYFSLVNDEDFSIEYSIYLDETEENTMPIYALRYNLVGEEVKLDRTGNISDLGETGNRVLYTGIIQKHTTHNYILKVWLGLQAENDAKDKTYSAKIRIEASQNLHYEEGILNGTDPVLTDNLVPVIIADDGVVTKADIDEEWYDYETQQWANAVVLADSSIIYNNGETIPEENIESYFVWIPRYKYKIFNAGEYTSVTGLENRVQTIEIEFESKNTTPTNGTSVGDWYSHPAFQAFDSNGFWVGKFESGYKDATSTSTAQVNSSDYSKLVIKPNVYSWRNITVGNAFDLTYNYLREDESHMMKNTEWGAVAYLQHSNYGSRKSVRVNNNSYYLTGYAAINEPTCGYNKGTSTSCNLVGTDSSVTFPYNTATGYTASTTGNISGVYDTSGGAYEYVMGYTTVASTVGGSSGLTGTYGDFFTNSSWEKYYDKYSTNSMSIFNGRILGDATGEMGPFGSVTDPDGGSRQRGSWYNNYAYFVYSNASWFCRGGHWGDGIGAGVFDFATGNGSTIATVSFRVVLTP